MASPSIKPVIIQVEGLVGAGKTTFIRRLTSGRSDIKVLCEPLTTWTDLGSFRSDKPSFFVTRESFSEYGDKSGNLLERAIQDQNNLFCDGDSMATFQFHVVQTKARQHKALEPGVRFIVEERSVGSSVGVFAKMFMGQQRLRPLNFEALRQMAEFLWVDTMVPDVVVVLDVDVAEAEARQQARFLASKVPVQTEEYNDRLGRFYEAYYRTLPRTCTVLRSPANMTHEQSDKFMDAFSATVNACFKRKNRKVYLEKMDFTEETTEATETMPPRPPRQPETTVNKN